MVVGNQKLTLARFAREVLFRFFSVAKRDNAWLARDADIPEPMMSRISMAAMDKSYYSVHSENLVEVLYERGKYGYGTGGTVSMLCSRVTAKNRQVEFYVFFFFWNSRNISVPEFSSLLQLGYPGICMFIIIIIRYLKIGNNNI